MSEFWAGLDYLFNLIEFRNKILCGGGGAGCGGLWWYHVELYKMGRGGGQGQKDILKKLYFHFSIAVIVVSEENSV